MGSCIFYPTMDCNNPAFFRVKHTATLAEPNSRTASKWQNARLLIKWSAKEAIRSTRGQIGHLRVKSQTPKGCQPDIAASLWKAGRRSMLIIHQVFLCETGPGLSPFTVWVGSIGCAVVSAAHLFHVDPLSCPLALSGTDNYHVTMDPPLFLHIWSFMLDWSRPGDLIRERYGIQTHSEALPFQEDLPDLKEKQRSSLDATTGHPQELKNHYRPLILQ